MYALRGSAGSAYGEVTAGGTDFSVVRLGPKLQPQPSDGIIYSLVQKHGLNVSLYRKPFDVKQFFQQESNQRRKADLSFVLEPRKIDLEYTVPSGELCFSI